MDPLLSIIIPTRDRPALLLAAVESALGQTVERQLEVVVVDNGSQPPVALRSRPPAEGRALSRGRHGGRKKHRSTGGTGPLDDLSRR